jgi:hypothetical protein
MRWIAVSIMGWIGITSAMAQGTASMTGLVLDAGGALVPGAVVRVRHAETNLLREMASSGEGEFTITNLAPGSYELTVEKAGFRSHRVAGIVLEIGQVLRQEIRLEVGKLSEAVSVTSEVALVNTDSGAIKGEVITNEQINELPLDGRDFFDLALLVPGVVPMAQGGQGSGLNVNGSRSDSTNYSVDGFNNRNPRGAGTYVRPNMSAMQEFKMEVSGFSAENGRMAGGVMNMVLKSGTNRLHGDVFEYLRNDVFDARTFFDVEKQPLRRNQFGATLNGPVRIPGLYNGRDRTFFLFSWEAYREVLGQTRLGNVPTALQRAGDFSQSVVPITGARLFLRDPAATGSCSATASAACFPGNRMPASRFDPIAQKLMAHYPLPNRADPNFNFMATAKDFDRWGSFMGKLDHRFNNKTSAAFRIQHRTADNTNPFGGSDLGGWPTYVHDPRHLIGVDVTHMFSPTLIMEVRGGSSRNATLEREAFQGQDIAGQLGIAGTTRDPKLMGFPRFTVQDYLPIGSAAGQPVEYFVTLFQVSNKWTWIKGKHAMKWGWDVERTRFNQPFNDNSRGTFNFQRNWTNHSVGDLLLGLMQSTTRTFVPTRNYLRMTTLGSFFNDDFKVTRSLTLNLGMRYELDLPAVERYGRASNFVPGMDKVVVSSGDHSPELAERVARFNLQERVVFAREAGLPRSLVYADKINFAPRFGFAWRVPHFGRTTVIRGGYGIFFTGHLLNPIRTALMTGFPFSINQTFSRLAANASLVTLANPFPDERATETSSTNSNGYELRPKMGDLQSFSLTMERELATGWALEAAYVGSKGTHLGRQYDINQPYRTLEAYQANIAFPRPITGINTINYFAFGSNSNYHAGQLSLRRQLRGAFLRANYSYSKSIDDASQLSGNSTGGFAGAQDSRNLRSERGRSDFDRRHVVTGTYSMPLPFGRGRKFLRNVRGVRHGMVGGWQTSGTVSFATGQAFTVTSANVDTNLGESQRPNRIGSGVMAENPALGRRGVDYPWFQIADFEPVPRCASRSVCEASAHGFTPFRFGNSGRNILDGPNLFFVNMAMLKNFRMRERRNFQLRYEVFNILNKANFQLPNRQFNALGGGFINTVVDRGRGGPRVMQLALKYEF